ncbi:DoxX family protein [Saccharopolyspora phatthalungensis]|uniref:Putative membrane protein YphA (DoxX/SURF4 family) n=1 Tax=Saccharopolyspora phatthalungensis TaxID=664693 RepID=A0A840QF66_9PSEU|nr:DoxX family protein [Saccharopolyspora phatthalungensis]MBB5159066.1 putative membrane protein YphA (DoxX/SURF4 family) [Saccharopolyspora phatthalungensis]
MAEHASIGRTIGNGALWTLQVLLAAYFLYSGYLLFGDDFVQKFDEIGVGHWLRYLTAVLEIAGAIGLLIPRLCGLAALGLACVMIGAVGTELFLLAHGNAVLPAILFVLAATVGWLRRDTITALLTRPNA